ncbi:hypothetical protein [Pedobacter xixiisoli]|uniref:Uncharacterized protein n=1 Tax=Pedobacter xixiisoli TaxID=1476464 RepID=A0A285ZYH0_9SPHI|nr:hypothetical protein [Pedobacter xixiisoli]SOD14695.1 hypothetical protein SAMN06297358_1705 [Pedobacter xixiisoli]
MKNLELPPTIRIANLDEVPKTNNYIDRIIDSKTAKIIEGFTFQENTEHKLPFSFFSEINVDNSQLWKVFKALTLSYEEEISFIFNHVDAEPNYSEYCDKYEVLNKIEDYQVELSQDGFIEFGVIYHDDDKLKEAYVKKAKYIQFWGNDKDEFLEIMHQFSLYQIDDLKFIDDFPLVTESLYSSNPNTIRTEKLLETFRNIFTLEK